MRSSLYPRLAAQNLLKNRQIYLPFIAASALMVFVFYTVASFAYSEDFGRNIPYGGNIQILMGVGLFLMPLICAPFLWYINSFLIKRRKKELGLYGVLGMGRRHVAVVMSFESLYCMVLSLAVGLLGGMVLGRLLFLGVLNLVQAPVDMVYRITWTPVGDTLKLFVAVYAVILAYNLFQVSLAHPVTLMQETQKGEKDSRMAPLIALFGVVCLSWGYWISFHADIDPSLIGDFFCAVMLVIFGTYGIFTSLSIYFLKALKANRRFYYRDTHFISVSGMLHRMRKNAAGLVNICIFGTMVLISLACSVMVLLGQEQVLTLAQNPPEGLPEMGLNLAKIEPQELYTMFGTLVFLGIFFSVVFFACTVLIMYYKQITEGYEDQARFEVMRQVGMDETLVRRTVGRQILMVFFIPLAATLVHTAFALPIITRIMAFMRITDASLVLFCLAGTALAFALVYAMTYLITAKTYYRLVR